MPTVQRLQHTSIPMPPGGGAAAREFFGEILGMKEVRPPSSLDVDALVWFLAGDDGHEIHVFTEERLGPNSTGQHLCLQVDDIDGIKTLLQRHGVAIEETISIVNRPRFFIHDPFGNRIEITEITGPYE